MVDRVIGPKGPGFPPSGEAPKKISSVLAHNVGQTDHVAKGAVLFYGFSDLEGRVTPGPADKTDAEAVSAANMLQWRGW